MIVVALKVENNHSCKFALALGRGKIGPDSIAISGDFREWLEITEQNKLKKRKFKANEYSAVEDTLKSPSFSFNDIVPIRSHYLFLINMDPVHIYNAPTPPTSPGNWCQFADYVSFPAST